MTGGTTPSIATSTQRRPFRKWSWRIVVSPAASAGGMSSKPTIATTFTPRQYFTAFCAARASRSLIATIATPAPGAPRPT